MNPANSIKEINAKNEKTMDELGIDEFYIYDFKVGGDESSSQNCLVSTNNCGLLEGVSVIRKSKYDQLKAENEKLRNPQNTFEAKRQRGLSDYLNSEEKQ